MKASAATNCATLIAFAYLLCLFQFPLWPGVVVFLVGPALFDVRSIRFLALSNIAFWIFTGSLFALVRPERRDQLYGLDFIVGNTGLATTSTPLVLIGSLSLFALLYYLVFKTFCTSYWARRPVLIYLLFFFGFGFTAELMPIQGVAKAILWSVFFAISKAFWMICYQLSEVDLLKKRPFFEHFGTTNPVWQIGWGGASVVRGLSDHLNQQVHDEADRSHLRLRAVKLLLYALVLQYIYLKLQDFSYHDGVDIFGLRFDGLSHHLGIELTELNYIELRLPRLASWLLVFIKSTLLIIGLAAYTNAAISIARMAGFNIKRQVYKPFRAMSFNDFLNRVYFYYIAILQRFFFYPLWTYSRPIKNRSLRVFSVHFLSIFFGGLINWSLRYAPHWAEGGFEAVALALNHKTPYLFLLGIFSGASAIVPRSLLRDRFPLARYVMPAFYFFLYSLCFSLRMSTPTSGLKESFRAFLFLFGHT